MSFTFCSSGAILWKAGKNVSSDVSGSLLASFCDEAEQYIIMSTRNDYLTSFSGLATNKKKILQEIASDIAAIYAIQYDMSAYTSKTEAITMLNILWARAEKGLSLISEDRGRAFLG